MVYKKPMTQKAVLNKVKRIYHKMLLAELTDEEKQFVRQHETIMIEVITDYNRGKKQKQDDKENFESFENLKELLDKMHEVYNKVGMIKLTEKEKLFIKEYPSAMMLYVSC